MQCIKLQRYVRKGNDAKKEPSNFQLLFVTERTQLNATHAQLPKKIEIDHFSRNMLISNDPFVRISGNLAEK